MGLEGVLRVTLRSLGSIARITSGGTPSRARPEFWGGDIPWVKTTQVQNGVVGAADIDEFITPEGLRQLGSKLVPKNAILLAMVGQGKTRGQVALLDVDAAINQNCAAVIPSAEMDARFLFQQLLSSYEQLRLLSNSSGQNNLNASLLRSFKIYAPPIDVQKFISQVLGDWDAAIGKTSSVITSLEHRKQGLMQQLLTGRRRLKGFSDKWKSVGIGSLANDARNINTTGQALPVLSCTKYAGLVDSLTYFNKRVFSENTASYKIVQRGQFVYATNHIEEGSIGYQNLHDAALVSPMYTVFEPDAEVINHQFLFMLLKTEAMRRVFEATTHSSVDRRGSLRWPEFAKLKIRIPPMQEQEQIVAVLETASSSVELANQQLAEFKTQKRALMQKLLSGEWRFPETPTQTKTQAK